MMWPSVCTIRVTVYVLITSINSTTKRYLGGVELPTVASEHKAYVNTGRL